MSPVLPFDIIALIIDIVGENEDTNLLKELALVSHSFHQICSKHLFATVELRDANMHYNMASSKEGFIKLLKSRPDVVDYIRNLAYKVGSKYEFESHKFIMNDDHHLSPILPNFLRTISCLNCLTLDNLDWNTLNASLISAFLHLMHLNTINHINLSLISNFPLSSLTPSVNLRRLDIFDLKPLEEEDGSLETVVQSELMPKIREFNTSRSDLLMTKLLHAKSQDGRPAFNFTDLRRLSMYLTRYDERNIRYLLQNAKSLEKLHLSVNRRQSLVGLLSTGARTLKSLDLTVFLCDVSVHQPLAGLCEELEAMAGHNMLEALSLKVIVDVHDSEDFIGPIIQDVEKELVKPWWSALRQVSFEVKVTDKNDSGNIRELAEALQSLPDKYLGRLSNLESVAFNYSVY
jgi:hypothetical protein